MAKKTPESKEDAAARRQRELALLTSGVAAFSLMGETPRTETPAAAPVAAPAPAAVAQPLAPPAATPAPEPAREPEGQKAAAQPAVAATPVKATAAPASAPTKRVGEEAAASSQAATAPPAVGNESDADEEAERDAPEAETLAPSETGELDLTRLFVPSAEKKGTTLRITADHQQFFTNLGFLLGNGASAPDIIHNILTRFRADHEAQIQKAMKKQMRQLMAPRK